MDELLPLPLELGTGALDPASEPVRAGLAPQRNGYVLARFVGDLRLLRRLLPLILCLIILASSLPQFFLWYIGEFVRCFTASCSASWLGMQLPLSLTGLALIALAGIGLRITSWLAFETTGMWATNALHDRLIAALAAARTTYFDETPSGHLLNRITGDFGNLRFMGIIRLGDATNASVEVVATMVLVGFISPWPALLMLPVTVAFFKMQLDIGSMLGHAEELGSKHQGEVLHRATDMIEGRRIYALYGKQTALLRSLHQAYTKLSYARLLSARLQAWSRVWTRSLSAVYGFAVCLFLTLGVQQQRISLTLAAVIVSALFSLASSFGWLSWCLAFMNETLGNARRVYEVVDLPAEGAAERASAVPAGVNPAGEAGALVFAQLSASYRRGSPLVLNDFSLTIAPGSKVGIIGRTGAGKSSVVQALFRMLHVAGGDIRLGGRSLYDQPVEAVRSLFGIVPQNPYLFQGTLRANLDRYGAVSDQVLLNALEAVELRLPLDLRVEEGGRNFSQGERQLLCLARVLVGGRPFLLMDEPTSAVDLATDAKIQRLLFEQLAGRTLITLAHRLESLRRYDRVVLLDGGKVVQDGPPSLFLGDPG